MRLLERPAGMPTVLLQGPCMTGFDSLHSALLLLPKLQFLL
jgi:hypothetical protein